jgi:hypothetical protein
MKKIHLNPVRLPFFLFHAGYAGLAVRLQSLLVRLDPKPERRRALVFFRMEVPAFFKPELDLVILDAQPHNVLKDGAGS